MRRTGVTAISWSAVSLLTACVSPPLYVGPPRTVTASSYADPAGPGYSGLIHHGIARRSAGRELTTGSEVPRDAMGNLVTADASDLTAPKPRHHCKHWFGL